MNPEKLLVVLRVLLGWTFLTPAYAKLFGTLTPTSLAFDMGKGQIKSFVGGYGVSHGYEWYRGFLQTVVMHHAGLFGALVTVGELYVAFALLFGITTRLAAGVAIFMLLNFMAAKGVKPWIQTGEESDIVLCLIVMIGSAGRTLGVDRFLHERYPRIPIW
jgi:uncharacterized membrane protein YphA (DoxX/SURF4 family)